MPQQAQVYAQHPLAQTRRSIAGEQLAEVFAGAPLDAVKSIAAVAMVIDHIDVMLLSPHVPAMWEIGRLAYPLFAFAVVCNLLRGTPVPRYLQGLLLLAAVSQPAYAIAMGGESASTIVTLVLAAAVVVALERSRASVQHAVFAIGVVAIFTRGFPARAGIDFGLAGILLPAAMLIILKGGRSHLIWLLALIIGLNMHRQMSAVQILVASLPTGLGAVAVLWLATALRGRPRFLPRYGLHVFYPAHLLALSAIRTLAG